MTDGNAKCPFFIRADSAACRLSCEALENEALCRILKFPNGEKFRGHYRAFCCLDYGNCPHYMALMDFKYIS